MSKLLNKAEPTASAARSSVRRHLLAIGTVSVVLVFGIGTLGATTELAGAVMATGSLVVQSSVKKVQHQTGGTVGSLWVVEGSHVAAGDLLVHLDDTVARATLSALTKQLDELSAQQSRLEAERDGVATVSFPRDLLTASDATVARVVAGEQKLFELRRAARAGQKGQLDQRVAQLRNEIAGLREQGVAKDGELAIVRRELVGVKDLYDRSLIQLTRLNGLERDLARISGERGALTAQTAQVEGRIAETQLQIIQIDADLHSDVAKQLGEIRAKLSDLVERKVVAQDQLQHGEIRAPQDGVVHELAVHAPGAVIVPGEPIMLIVPDADRLIVEVHVAPGDVDKLVLHQDATLRFPSFNQRVTPEINARVTRIAADTTTEARSGLPYYLVQISLPTEQVKGDVSLRPGMPVDAFIKTADRTMLSYLVKPLADQVSRAFREK